MFRKFMLLAGVVGMAAMGQAWADVIFVSGDVTGIWSADSVIVMAEVRVPPGQSLIIEPGVRVLFHGSIKFIIDYLAILRAEGTVQDSIFFTSLSDSRWRGLRFLSSSDSCRLAYCYINNSFAYGLYPYNVDNFGGGIYCDNAHPEITHCLIDNCTAGGDRGGGGIYCGNDSHPVISDNTILSCLSNSMGAGISCWYSTPTISNNVISGNYAKSYGGGIACYHSNASILGNSITENTCGYTDGFYTQPGAGGGIFCWDSDALIEGNLIVENEAYYDGGQGGGISCDYSNPAIMGNQVLSNSAPYGGGLAFSYSDPILMENTISHNQATAYLYGTGGGIYCHAAQPCSVLSCSIDSNQAEDSGGGIYISESAFVISQCVIRGNSADMAGGILCLDSEALICYNTIIGNAANFPYWDGDDGGGLYIQGSSPEVYRNIFFGNSATRIGGGIYSASEVYSNIEHCTFYANTAAYGGGAIACLESQYYVSELSVNNCILWANTAVGIIPGTAILNVSYCDIMGGWSGIGNLNAAPMFLNSPGGDFHLLWGSPCIDAGDPSSPLDPDSTRADMGAFYYDQSVGIAENPAFELPSNFLLHHCSPNPFNPTTAFSYQLSANSFVSLRVYDTAGRLVQTLVDGWREAGAHEVTFDGSGLAAGIYFARLRAGEYVGVEKMVLLK